MWPVATPTSSTRSSLPVAILASSPRSPTMDNATNRDCARCGTRAPALHGII
jgi:hypothetical protein